VYDKLNELILCKGKMELVVGGSRDNKDRKISNCKDTQISESMESKVEVIYKMIKRDER